MDLFHGSRSSIAPAIHHDRRLLHVKPHARRCISGDRWITLQMLHATADDDGRRFSLAAFVRKTPKWRLRLFTARQFAAQAAKRH